ncbi:hypothetical protein ANCDUO_09605 [Ancylostoma duodenale]|uniref:Uncharacterized protein n=1 Tax=Ancylostoma duodenale TaxID=51022 RepID=A0A0C2GG83_9BILA|nr:hypothetical protein ANCDUO_09605 [Ancylostoma duodenale]
MQHVQRAFVRGVSEIDGDVLQDVLHDGKIDCVPRADAVFIRFHSQPDDPWAIDQIDVDVFFILDRDNIETPSHLKEGRQTYNWHFEHAVLMPCSSWLKGTHLYQIGPRNGLFIEHEYLAMPSPGQWEFSRNAELPYLPTREQTSERCKCDSGLGFL